MAKKWSNLMLMSNKVKHFIRGPIWGSKGLFVGTSGPVCKTSRASEARHTSGDKSAQVFTIFILWTKLATFSRTQQKVPLFLQYHMSQKALFSEHL
jgi:hypothetical protein